MIKSIYSSKLYRTSSRKERIHAALLAPGNLGLVQQLAEDLDEEYKTPENLGQKPEAKESSAPEGDSLFVDEDVDPEKDLMTVSDFDSHSSGGGSHSPLPSAPSGDADSSDSEKPEAGNDELMPESPANEKPSEPEPAEASTNVMSSTNVTIDRTQPTIDINAIK